MAGQEAKRVYNDAQNLLKTIITTNKLQAHGVVAFYPANSVGDDIEVYDENGEVIEVLHGLRQQVRKPRTRTFFIFHPLLLKGIMGRLFWMMICFPIYRVIKLMYCRFLTLQEYLILGIHCLV